MLENILVSEPEEFTFKGAESDTIHAWLLKPVNFEKGKKYPLALIIHGGPQGAFLDDFHYRWNPQCFTGAGFVVLEINVHGSTGYGQKFTDSVSGDWVYIERNTTINVLRVINLSST